MQQGWNEPLSSPTQKTPVHVFRGELFILINEFFKLLYLKLVRHPQGGSKRKFDFN